MTHLIIEIKARCRDADAVRAALRAQGAECRGVDHQTDTYFRCPHGRLKLRAGTIENTLIHYHRPNDAEPKPSEVTLLPVEPGSPLKALLTVALGVAVQVRKQREIYFIDNVKFHIDIVEDLGSFLEIEAIDATGDIGREALEHQCRRHMEILAIAGEDLLATSYSDMLLARKSQQS